MLSMLRNFRRKYFPSKEEIEADEAETRQRELESVKETRQRELESVNLDDWFEQVSETEMRDLAGKELNIVFVNEDRTGKVRPREYYAGYELLTRMNDGVIVGFQYVFPRGVNPTEEFIKPPEARLYKIPGRENSFFMQGGPALKYYYEGQRRFNEVSDFLSEKEKNKKSL